jgi:hypothetical protein
LQPLGERRLSTREGIEIARHQLSPEQVQSSAAGARLVQAGKLCVIGLEAGEQVDDHGTRIACHTQR